MTTKYDKIKNTNAIVKRLIACGFKKLISTEDGCEIMLWSKNTTENGYRLSDLLKIEEEDSEKFQRILMS